MSRIPSARSPARGGRKAAPAPLRTRAVASVALALASGAVVPSVAGAQTFADVPYSIDIEFVRPSFGHGGFAGVDTAMANRNLTWRVGTLWQYEANPLTLYQAVDQQELGSVVANRFSQHYGVSIDVQRVTFGVTLPLVQDWDSEASVPAAGFTQPGFKIGDLGLGGKLIVLQTPNDLFNIGARAGIILPTGTQNAYVGEGALRFTAGALASLNLGQLTLGTDFGLMGRPTKTTSEDFVASNEIQWNNGVRYRLPDATRVGLNAQLLSRSVLQEFLQGGAENSLEALGGVDVYASRRTTISAGAGRGLTEGYGTTDFRVYAGLMIQVPPPEPLPPTYVNEAPPPPIEMPPDVDVIIEEPPPEEPVFEEGEVAVKVRDRIYIKDMVEFVVDTNKIQPYSIPTLEAVAKLINEDPYIANMVIEGHASQEGSYDHNYELAESRARAIWEKLMEFGVARDRIAYRGMGEVEPIKEGEEEEALQANRRVEFHITRQYEGPEEMPDYPAEQTLPWNGSVVKVVSPPRPEPPPPPPEPEGPKLDEFGLPIDDEEE